LSIEFRNRTWFEGKHADITLDFERDRGLVNCTVDEPQNVKNSIPSVWDVTNPRLSIVRLHGRNHHTWNKKGLRSSSQRFDYDYKNEELRDLAKQIQSIAAESVHESVHVIFNNNYGDQGQRNARTLAGMIKPD
jgi:uncharacterized protein YecE (DUF72 family)